jgi:hypothetical protein
MPGFRLGAACVLLVVGSMLCLPATSTAEVSCSYSPENRTLFMFVTEDDTGLISRSGDEIVLAGAGGAKTPCASAPVGGPSVTNVDRVRLVTSGEAFVDLKLTGGPFAPGATFESSGFPEIEFDWVSAGGLIVVSGTPLTDAFRWGSNAGLNLDPGLNGDRDLDLTTDSEFPLVVASGLGGDDRITPQTHHVGGIPFSEGGRGDDLLRTGGGGGLVVGGPGRDSVIGGPSFDLISAGPGRDRVRSGRGSDLILAVDGTRDRIFCGRGFDLARADARDRVRGCERVARVRASASGARADARRPGPRAHADQLRRLARVWTRLSR